MKTEVSIIMGSLSDFKTMEEAVHVLEEFGVHYEVKIVSAHRTPELMMDFARKARDRGVEVIIAGAGGAAHLPGMVASLTTLPVIGVPVVSSQSLLGIDSLLSIVQMPAGVPVGTVGIGNARNAALLAIRILALTRPDLTQKLADFAKKQEQKVVHDNQELNKNKDN
ncbi:MAG: 5-(carboxyamino)imidazole ribonucleotide mutase [Leptospiraceae bacterium]|nr:5-(carboxyamino)imidazole ribonucleotide mutase [Leptospiraceae bacterium]MDW8305536.1 5-(carboxyamino)imidazole ribonucleotide mutase [Leptospiraceae bacterium]